VLVVGACNSYEYFSVCKYNIDLKKKKGCMMPFFSSIYLIAGKKSMIRRTTLAVSITNMK